MTAACHNLPDSGSRGLAAAQALVAERDRTVARRATPPNRCSVWVTNSPLGARRPDHPRAQPACRRPTAAFSIVGSSSSTAVAAGPSGMKLSSLVTRVIRPA